MTTTLFDPTPTPGGAPPATVGTLPGDSEQPPQSPPPAPAPAAPAPSAEPPPAARIVVTGERTEREIELESELEAERGRHAETAREKKDRELKIAELQDKLDQLRGEPPPPDKEKTIHQALVDYMEGN